MLNVVLIMMSGYSLLWVPHEDRLFDAFADNELKQSCTKIYSQFRSQDC